MEKRSGWNEGNGATDSSVICSKWWIMRRSIHEAVEEIDEANSVYLLSQGVPRRWGAQQGIHWIGRSDLVIAYLADMIPK
jgi:hypothetical protein